MEEIYNMPWIIFLENSMSIGLSGVLLLDGFLYQGNPVLLETSIIQIYCGKIGILYAMEIV